MFRFLRRTPARRMPVKRIRRVEPTEFTPTAIYEDPPEGFVEVLGDWAIRNRHYFLLALISIGFLVAGAGMLTTLFYTSARLMPAVTLRQRPPLAPGLEVALMPTAAMPALVPDEIVEVVELIPTATLSASDTAAVIEPAPTKAAVTAKPNSIDPTPGRLIIPGLELEEDIQQLNLVDNSWDIQSLGLGVGLLEATGRFPGDDYSMVFAGHVSTYWTFWGPFARLAQLDRGSQVIYQWNGEEYVYEITGARRIQPTDGELLFQRDEGTILLLTCIGYDHATGDYAERLLVEAKLVQEPVATQ